MTALSTCLLLVLLCLTFASHAAKGFSALERYYRRRTEQWLSSSSSMRLSSSLKDDAEEVESSLENKNSEPSWSKTSSRRSSSSSSSSKWWHDLIPTVDDVFEETLGMSMTDENDATENTNNKSNTNNNSSSILGNAMEALWVSSLSPHLDVHLDELDLQEEEETNHNDGYGPVLQQADVVHFCFLVHGHRGYSRDLSYLQAVMRKLAAAEKKKQWRASTTTQNNNNNNSNQKKLIHDLVVHAPVCNERKTDDGVKAGGERLVEEIIQVIQTEMVRRGRHQQQSAPPPAAESDSVTTTTDSTADEDDDDASLPLVTISLLGNSLGGIYSRYAIRRLMEQCRPALPGNNNNSGCYVLPGICRFHLNIFCTTATPHLGIASHTFLPIPRTAEIGVAHAMGDTGRDLFRLNDLMKRMATAPEFLTPLRAFRHRIAYANAYGTDFPVPMQTAAFLSSQSTYPHHFVEDSADPDRLVVDDNGLVIATLHTHATTHTEDDDDDCQQQHECYVDPDENDELVRMSNSLDALGWKKVFVDVRKEVPKISLPKAEPLTRILPTSLLLGGSNGRGSSSSSSSASSDEDSNHASSSSSSQQPASPEPSESGDDDAAAEASSSSSSSSDDEAAQQQQQQVEAIHLLKEKGQAIGSRDVAAALSKPLFDSQKLHLPVGHNMIVAFSRSRLWAYLNKAGRPVVDTLARDLVDSIFRWNPQQEDAAAAAAALRRQSMAAAAAAAAASSSRSSSSSNNSTTTTCANVAPRQ